MTQFLTYSIVDNMNKDEISDCLEKTFKVFSLGIMTISRLTEHIYV